MNLKDFKPKKSFFKLKATGWRKNFLRPLTLNDEIWIEENLLIDGVLPDFSVDLKALVRAVYNQLENKKPFIAQDITVINEDGLETVENHGGYKLLLKLVVGGEERIAILTAWLECLGLSRPNQDKLVKKK